MKSTWVLVADEAIVRVLRRPSNGGTLEPVHAMTDPDAHGRDADFRHDAVGRRTGGSSARFASGGQHGFAHGANATASAADTGQHQAAAVFAKQVADWLHAACLQHRFDELHVAAAPRFLGLLRKAFSKQVTERVVREIDKDWVQTDDTVLTERLFPAPAGSAR